MEINAYIALGSNLGERSANLRGGLEGIGALESTTLGRCSKIIETDPVGPGVQGRYLNAVVQIRTGLAPGELLEALLAIETRFGRDRSTQTRWGARTLDLDLLMYGDRTIDEPGLRVPHPFLHTRSFVLIPLCEIAPDELIPGYKKTPRELLGALESCS